MYSYKIDQNIYIYIYIHNYIYIIFIYLDVCNYDGYTYLYYICVCVCDRYLDTWCVWKKVCKSILQRFFCSQILMCIEVWRLRYGGPCSLGIFGRGNFLKTNMEPENSQGPKRRLVFPVSISKGGYQWRQPSIFECVDFFPIPKIHQKIPAISDSVWQHLPLSEGFRP